MVNGFFVWFSTSKVARSIPDIPLTSLALWRNVTRTGGDTGFAHQSARQQRATKRSQMANNLGLEVFNVY